MTHDQPSSPTVRTLLLRNLRLIVKRKWLFALIFVAVASAGIIHSLTQTPIYQTSATVMFERASSNEISPLAALNPVMSTVSPHEFFKSVLNSSIYRKQLAQTLRDSGYVPPPGMSIKEAALQNLAFTIDKNNAFADIIAREGNGESAYLMVNSALATFLNRSKELQRAELQATLDFLDQQMIVITHEIEQVERRVQEFQEQNGIDPADAERGVWGELYDLQRELTSTEVEFELEKLNNRAYGNRFNILAMQSVEEVSKENVRQIESYSSEIETLQTDLDRAFNSNSDNANIAETQKQLQIKRQQLINLLMQDNTTEPRLKQERSIMMQSLIESRTQSDLSLMALSNQKAYLERSIGKFENDHPDLLESSLAYTSMLRQKDVLQNTFNLLTEKREEARIQSASETGGLKVIDPPYIAEHPESTNQRMYIGVTLILALLLAFGVSFVADLLDDSFKDPDEVAQLLGLSTLGFIPNIRPNRNGNSGGKGGAKKPFDADPKVLMIDQFSPDDPVVEAYRALKTNITFSFPDSTLNALTISSPQAGEGKSLTSANLAISFAMSGMNTLLIDCDLRRPLQHTLFDLPRSPGLSDILFNDINDKEYHQQTRIPKLHLVTVGSQSPNPADLLSSDKMSKFISINRKAYDVVLLDTPPVTFAVDARLLANRTDGLILVVQNEKTSVELARKSIDFIERVGGRVAGTVVNMINQRSYYYAYYYDSTDKN